MANELSPDVLMQLSRKIVVIPDYFTKAKGSCCFEGRYISVIKLLDFSIYRISFTA